jgi:hypothetical protein
LSHPPHLHKVSCGLVEGSNPWSNYVNPITDVFLNNGGHFENGGHLETFKGHQNSQWQLSIAIRAQNYHNRSSFIEIEQKCQFTRGNVVKRPPFLNGVVRDRFVFIKVLRLVHCITVPIFIQIAEGVAEIWDIGWNFQQRPSWKWRPSWKFKKLIAPLWVTLHTLRKFRVDWLKRFLIIVRPNF